MGGRKTHKDLVSPVHRVRLRKGKNVFRSALLTGRSPKKAAGRSRGGRILSSTRLGMEEMLKVGEYFKLGDQLMKEFAEEKTKEKTDEEEVSQVVRLKPKSNREVV